MDPNDMYNGMNGFGTNCNPGSYANGAFYDDDQDTYVARTSPPSSPDVDSNNVFCFFHFLMVIERAGRAQS